MNLLDTAVEYETRKANACDKLYVDISQDVHRKPWSQNAIRAVTTSSEIFSCAHRRILLPLEHLSLMGYDLSQVDVELVSSLKTWALRDLSGQCMALPCIALPVVALLQSLELPL